MISDGMDEGVFFIEKKQSVFFIVQRRERREGDAGAKSLVGSKGA